VIVHKRQHRSDGIDQLILVLTASGPTTGEVAAHFEEVYGATVSMSTTSPTPDRAMGTTIRHRTTRSHPNHSGRLKLNVTRRALD
jgi:transposase-like protein